MLEPGLESNTEIDSSAKADFSAMVWRLARSFPQLCTALPALQLKDAKGFGVGSCSSMTFLRFRSNAVDRHLAEQSGSSVVAFVALRVSEKLLERGVAFFSKV